MFLNCHYNNSFSGWPDGRGYLDQSNLMVAIFNVLREEYNKYMNKKAGSNGKRN